MKKSTLIIGVVFMTLLSVRVGAIPIEKLDSLEGINSKNAPEYILYKSAKQKYARGDLKEARTDYLKSLKANPIFFPSMIGMADIEDRAGHKQKAEDYFKKAFDVTKNNSSLVHAAYGKFLFKYNDISGAKQEFEKALEINPAQPDANTELAVIYLSRLNKPNKAIEHYQKAIDADPDNISLQYGLSTAQSAAGNTDGAIATLKRVANKLPGNAVPWEYMGINYDRAGRFNEAIDALKKSIKLDPKRVQSRWILADTYAHAKQFNNALQEYQWVIDNTKQKDVAYFKQGLVYQINKDYANAQAAYLKASQSNPKLPDPYNNLAYMTLETKKDYQKGIEWAKKAVSLKADSPVFLDTLGWLYYQVKDYKNAMQYLQRAVNNKPASAEANYHLGKVYEAMKDKTNAEKYFKKAQEIDSHFKPTN